MKIFQKFILIILASLAFSACKTTEESVSVENFKDKLLIDNNGDLLIEFTKGESFNFPAIVIWMEDMEGNYLNTFYITQSYASGIFGHQMRGDTMWMPNEGPSSQPAALPYWSYRKGLIDGESIVPTPDHPFVDAYTGATPSGSFNFETTQPTKDKYRLLVEVNQPWDWNEYWTNNKYPDNFAYKHSAQPSIIYAVTISDDNSVFHLNPIGHGNPRGENGNLFTDLNTLTTAKEIFSSIKVTIRK